MSIIGLNYFIFLILSLIFYFSLKKYQYIILFVFSIIFYLLISDNRSMILLLMFVILIIVYFSGIIIGKFSGIKQKIALIISIILLIFLLIYFKYFNNLFITFASIFSFKGDIDFFNIINVVGISYYTLSAISYLIDIYWGTCKYEKNIIKLGLFIYYFPCLISGPINRYNQFETQIREIYNCDYDRISHGIRRMIFGYVKKIVIASRFNIPMIAIFNKYNEISGASLLFAICCYVIELYADFSGCMDIIIGTSMIYGIKLPENFKAPFFSHSVKEFWQRWHITLGGWFKDYVMYPIQKSTPVVLLMDICKTIFPKKVVKRISLYIGMVALWVLIGLWHGGTIVYFVATGILPMLLLFIEDILYPIINKIVKIDSKNIFFSIFECIRTFLLICLCWGFICSGNIQKGLIVLNRIFTKFIILQEEISLHSFIEFLKFSNLKDVRTVLGLLLAIPIIFISDYLLYKKGITIFDFTDKFHYIFRIIIIHVEILCIIFLGAEVSEFIYFQF